MGTQEELQQIQLLDLLASLAASMSNIIGANTALSMGHTHQSDGDSFADRIKANRGYCLVITGEIKRRLETKEIELDDDFIAVVDEDVMLQLEEIVRQGVMFDDQSE